MDGARDALGDDATAREDAAQFIGWLLAVLGVFVPAKVAFAAFHPMPVLLVSAGLLLAATIAIAIAYRWARRRRTERAVITAAVALDVYAALAAPPVPWSTPVLLFLPLVAAALALSYLRGRRMYELLLLSLAVEIWVTLMAAVLPRQAPMPRVLDAAMLMVGIAASFGLLLLLLFQFARRQQQTLERLREAVRVREDFLSIAGHELRTPLTPLKLQLDMLRRDLASGTQGSRERAARRVDSLQRQVHRLSHLVRELLDVSQMTRRPVELRRERIDLTALAREVAARFEDIAGQVGSPLSVEAAEPVVGRWDALHLEQLLIDLLSNAIKYGQGHPVRVRVWRDGDVAHLSVRDEGVGVPLEDQVRIFEPFERGGYGGLGLGLYVVRRVAEAHHGRVRVDSAPGQGATFTVDLPMKDAAWPKAPPMS